MEHFTKKPYNWLNFFCFIYQGRNSVSIRHSIIKSPQMP